MILSEGIRINRPVRQALHVRHNLRVVVDLLPGAVRLEVPAWPAEHFQQPAAVAGLLAASAASPSACESAGGRP